MKVEWVRPRKQARVQYSCARQSSSFAKPCVICRHATDFSKVCAVGCHVSYLGTGIRGGIAKSLDSCLDRITKMASLLEDFSFLRSEVPDIRT